MNKCWILRKVSFIIVILHFFQITNPSSSIWSYITNWSIELEINWSVKPQRLLYIWNYINFSLNPLIQFLILEIVSCHCVFLSFTCPSLFFLVFILWFSLHLPCIRLKFQRDLLKIQKGYILKIKNERKVYLNYRKSGRNSLRARFTWMLFDIYPERVAAWIHLESS